MNPQAPGEQASRKRCPKCGETKPREAFSKDRRARDGLRSQCRRCCAAYDAAYYALHREEVLARQAAYHATRREEKRAYDAAYRATHREERRAYFAAHRAENPTYHALMHERKRARYRRAAERATVRGRWTPAEDAVLWSWLRDGRTYLEIAYALGRTVKSVEWRVRAHKLSLGT